MNNPYELEMARQAPAPPQTQPLQTQPPSAPAPMSQSHLQGEQQLIPYDPTTQSPYQAGYPSPPYPSINYGPIHGAPPAPTTPMQFMAQAVNDRKMIKEYAKMAMEDLDSHQISQIVNWLRTRQMFIPRLGPVNSGLINCYDSLPGDLVQYINALSRVSNWSFDSLLLPTIGLIGAALRGRVQIVLDPHWNEPMAFYVVVGIQPGYKKSNIIESLVFPINEFVKHIQNEHQDTLATSKRSNNNIFKLEKNFTHNEIKRIIADNDGNIEAMVTETLSLSSRLAGFDKAIKPNVYPVTVVVDNISTLRLAQIMEQNGDSVCMIGAEDSVFYRLLNDPRTDYTLYLKGHTGESYRYETATKRPIQLDRPIINMVYIIQPEVMRALYTKREMSSRGFTPDFCHTLFQ